MKNIPARLAANPLRTRADARRAVLDLWAGVRPDLARRGAWATLAPAGASPGGPGARAEAFARPLWGVAPFAAGGGRFPDWPLVARVLVEGMDPAHPAFWGEARDRDQPCVEMGGIGAVLAWAGGPLGEHLTTAQRERLAAWLGGINRVQLVDNNWLWFRVLVNLGLRRIGAAWSPDAIAADLARLDEFHRGDGWYTDGAGPSRDHYIGWAMHFYGLLYAAWHGDADPAGAARYRGRAAAFAPQFAAWFAPDGAVVPLGRSLTYRFAAAAFWGALALAGVEALPWGVIRGLWARHLRWWLRRPIFTDDGRLTIGYGYPQALMAERYNVAASPYWALKAFAPLALPANHPFWRAREEPLPESDEVQPQPEGRVVACRDTASGHAFVLANHESDAASWLRHSAQKYGKFAYSASFAFTVAAGNPVPEQLGADSTLLLSDDGRDWRMRGRLEAHCMTGPVLRSRWRPWDDVEIETWLAPALPGHVRMHRIRAARPLRTVEGGFALDRERLLSTEQRIGDGLIVAATTEACSGLRSLVGARTARLAPLEPGTHLLFPLANVPWLVGEVPAGETWLACAVIARPGPGHAESAAAWLADCAAGRIGDGWVVRSAGRLVLAAGD